MALGHSPAKNSCSRFVRLVIYLYHTSNFLERQLSSVNSSCNIPSFFTMQIRPLLLLGFCHVGPFLFSVTPVFAVSVGLTDVESTHHLHDDTAQADVPLSLPSQLSSILLPSHGEIFQGSHDRNLRMAEQFHLEEKITACKMKWSIQTQP